MLMNRAVANAEAVDALPVNGPVKAPVNVVEETLVSPERLVTVSPSCTLVEPMVTEVGGLSAAVPEPIVKLGATTGTEKVAPDSLRVSIDDKILVSAVRDVMSLLVPG